MRENHVSYSMNTRQCEILLLHAIFKLPFIRPKCKNEFLSTCKAPVQDVQEILSQWRDRKWIIEVLLGGVSNCGGRSLSFCKREKERYYN